MSSPVPEGKRIGRYEIRAKIGEGGMGEVYAALQPAAGGEPRKLTDFKSDYIFRHAWSPDGRTLALVRGRGTSDVVLMRDEK